MYDRILLPTDGSPPADAALDHALDIASRYDARLHALYVVENEDAAFTRFGNDTAIIESALEEEGRKTLDGVEAAAAAEGVEAVTAVAEGKPHEAIREYADDNGIDLVVMGTHGRRGLDRYLLGSVTERVVRTSDVPVLTVRYVDEESSGG
ncbi:universal stress protein [Halegenticoccus soli]|uniref:universal stress protein n=1 Tax=Halegenticoccus soli TaxID=1985678 RepID=UPI000C6DFC67|nr:universal stress protein [Halegenticoccus soli]